MSTCSRVRVRIHITYVQYTRTISWLVVWHIVLQLRRYLCVSLRSLSSVVCHCCARTSAPQHSRWLDQLNLSPQPLWELYLSVRRRCALNRICIAWRLAHAHTKVAIRMRRSAYITTRSPAYVHTITRSLVYDLQTVFAARNTTISSIRGCFTHIITDMEEIGRPVDKRRGSYRQYLRDASVPVPSTTKWRMKRAAVENMEL